MDLGLTSKVALVAGGSAGLGAATATALLAEGARVSVCGRDRDRLRGTVADLGGRFGTDRVHGQVTDVTDEVAVAAWVDAVRERWDGPDIVVTNAGGPPPGDATEFGLDAYREALELNLLSAVSLTNLTLPSMLERGWGRLIFIASVTVKEPARNLALSNVARPGLLGYARSLVDEIGGRGTTVNVLAPGLTMTDRLTAFVESGMDLEELAREVPLQRLARPDEFGAVAAFLCSEPASYVTGTVLPVDGGLVRSIA